MKRVGVVVALAAECRSLTRKRLRDGDCLPLPSGHLLALSGAGPAAASRAATQLLDAGADALLSWGCAAALDPSLKSGDLVLPGQVIAAQGERLETSVLWRTHVATQLQGSVHSVVGDLAESSSIVALSQDKLNLHKRSGALALDMESAAMGRVAHTVRVPFLVVRAIADPASMTLPASVVHALDAQGVVRIPKLLGSALRNPLDFIGLARLGWHFHAAMQTLERAHRLIGHALLPPRA